MIQKTNFFKTIAAVLVLIILGCEEKEGIRQAVIVDVSERITGVPAFSGAGAEIEITGTRLDEVDRVIFGIYVVRKIDIETTATGIKFLVPGQVGLGENEVVLVFPGNERAFTEIMILPLQVVTYFDPTNGNAGDTINVYGNNLDIVDDISIGVTMAEIVSRERTLLRFIVPDGAVTDTIIATSGAGIARSQNAFHACETAVDDVRCLLNYCQYGGFENMGVPYGEWTGGGGPTIPDPDPGDPDQGAIFLQGAGNPLSRWELIEPIGGVPDLGATSLQVTILQVGTEAYEIQLVFNAFAVPVGRRFLYSGKIWSDADGRVALTQPETDPPGGYTAMVLPDGSGIPQMTLQQGWNEFAVEVIHDMERVPPQPDTEIRPGIKLSYPANLGGVFIFDDIRIVDIGPR